MTSNPSIVDEAENFLRRQASELTQPRENECLCCYMARVLDDFGCDGSHRLALHYRDTMAPRATALLQRLSQMGACCCDCEIFMNGYQLRDGNDDGTFGALAPCSGVRRGSVQPCRNWVRTYRGF